MDEFLTRMKDKTNGYLAFPNDHETNVFLDSIKSHFNALLRLEYTSQQIDLLAKFVYLLRRGYIILEDSEAVKLQMLIDLFPVAEIESDKSLLSSWTEVGLYLLEMYRIDGRNEEYKGLLAKIENATSKLDGYSKEELKLEKCKFLIAGFDYIQVVKEVENIDHEVSLDIQLKKVFLYKQIGEEEKGKDLLRKTSAVLSQKKYSENKTASLRGYLNLCARSLFNGLGVRFDDSFSDKEYYQNVYNVRNIYNQIKVDVSNSLLLAYNESHGKNPGFNPGTYKVTYGTATRKEQDAISKPLKYVMFQDLLCLPNTFSDHREILALGLKEVIQTSQVPIWKWSSIIRTNDSKIINTFFTRELIVSAQSKWIEVVYDQLSKLSDLFASTSSISNQRRILTQKTIFDVLTRFSVVVNDDKVIQLISKIIKRSKDSDDFDSRVINEFLGRLKHSLNSVVISHYFNELLESDSIPLLFLLTFLDSNVKIEQPEICDEIYNRIISELKSPTQDTRDRGIAKAILINTYSNFRNYDTEIGQALWGQLNENGSPKCSIFNIWVWEELPHPNNIDFDDLYNKYFNAPKFIRSVSGGTISGISSIDNPINEYIMFFRRNSSFTHVIQSTTEMIWTSQYFVKIINYIYDYIDNEKSLLTFKMDIFGMDKEGEKRFVKLGDFVALLIAQAYLSELITDEVKTAFNKVKKLLEEYSLTTISINIMDKILANDLSEKDIKRLMNQIIVGSRDELRQVMNAINILLAFELISFKNIDVSGHLVKLINSLKYFETQRSSEVIYQLTYVIDHQLLTKEEYRDIIIESFRENLEKLDLSLNDSDRDLIESIYSLSLLVRRYYDRLIQNEINVSEEFLIIIEELSHAKLKEVRYMWEDIPKIEMAD